ncbi:MAG: hypothetical protein JXB29_07190 [Sedimentisphaerales bacterium]|nr:hypothetical protein [Sedimentisphaerales bacterium]
MKTSRRDFLKTAGNIGLLSFFASRQSFVQADENIDKSNRAETTTIPFHKVKVEPLIKSSYPTHARFHDILGEQLVVITAEGLERIDWEVRPEKNCWLLRLPEMVFMNRKKFHYQTGMEWQLKDGIWFYENCPVRDLLGCWKDVGGKLQLDQELARQRPVVGSLAGRIRSDSQGAHYTLTVKNTSDKIWRDVFFWFCLNHYQSPITGYRPHFRLGSTWLPAQEMPSATVHTYYPANGMAEEYRTSVDHRFHAPDTELSFPGVACWNRTADGPLLVCHCSEDAVAIGSNQNWPCTDLNLWYSDIEPGQQKQKTGHILVAKADLKTFAKNADRLLKRLSID